MPIQKGANSSKYQPRTIYSCIRKRTRLLDYSANDYCWTQRFICVFSDDFVIGIIRNGMESDNWFEFYSIGNGKECPIKFFFLMIFCGIFFFQVILMRWHYRFERELDVVHLSFDTNRKCVSFRFGASEYFEWMCWNVWVHYLCGERKTKLVSPSSTKICIERACISFVLFQWFHIGSITLCFLHLFPFSVTTLLISFLCVFFSISFLIYLFIFPLLEILCC